MIFKKSRLSAYESNSERCALLVDVATNPALSLSAYLQLPEQIGSYTKKDVMDFIYTHYNYYAVAYKRKGERKTPKVEKPVITKVTLNKGQQSAFCKKYSLHGSLPLSSLYLSITPQLYKVFLPKPGVYPFIMLKMKKIIALLSTTTLT